MLPLDVCSGRCQQAGSRWSLYRRRSQQLLVLLRSSPVLPHPACLPSSTRSYVDFLDATGTFYSMANFMSNYIPNVSC